MRTSGKEMQNFWDSRAHRWNKHSEIDPIAIYKTKNALTPFLMQVPDDGSVLDVAAGANNVAYYPYGFDMSRVTALDISPKMLEFNSSGYKVLADANNGLKFPDGTFSTVISVFGVRYIRDHERFLLDCVRVTQPGKWTVLVDFEYVAVPVESQSFNSKKLAAYAKSLGLDVEREVIDNPFRLYESFHDLLAVRNPL